MNQMHGILFAYNKAEELRELVEERMPGSMPFGARYRAVDFMLSNFVNAGVRDVGLILSGCYQSLMDHVGNGKVWDMSCRYGGLRLLPPFDVTNGRQGLWRGKLEALAAASSYLQEIRQEYVVLADADLITNLSLQEVLQEHIASGADITVVCTEVSELGKPQENAAYLSLAEDGRVMAVDCCVAQAGQKRSLELYLLRKELLLQLVEQSVVHNHFSFRRNVLQAQCDSLHIHGYLWEGYVAQFHTVSAYYERSMELLDPVVRQQLFRAESPIWAKEEDGPSIYIDAACTNSLVADGCSIEGTVENSILFSGVRVERGASVKNCILFENTVVEKDSILRAVIADKEVKILAGRTLMGHENYPLVLGKGRTI